MRKKMVDLGRVAKHPVAASFEAEFSDYPVHANFIQLNTFDFQHKFHHRIHKQFCNRENFPFNRIFFFISFFLAFRRSAPVLPSFGRLLCSCEIHTEIHFYVSVVRRPFWFYVLVACCMAVVIVALETQPSEFHMDPNYMRKRDIRHSVRVYV